MIERSRRRGRDGASPRTGKVLAGTTALLFFATLCPGRDAFAGGRVGWPVAGSIEHGGPDPIAALRWSAESWITMTPARAESVLTEIDRRLRQSPGAANWLSYRAVALRILMRYDDARASLDQAVAMDTAVLQDPDVALTTAYLAARAQQWAAAVSTARGALPRVNAPVDHRSSLALEIARWSMARGREGLPDAIAVLREVAALGPPERMVRATLALALWRDGRTDEAREVASGGMPTAYEAMNTTRRGSVLPGEGDAAVGVALVLGGRAHDAVAPLSRAVNTVPEPWRPSISEFLATARRAAPGNSGAAPASPGNRPAAAPSAPARGAPRTTATAAPHVGPRH